MRLTTGYMRKDMTKGVEARRLTGDVKGRCEGHSGFCSHLQVHQDSSTQNEPPSFVDASASTSDADTAVNEPTPTQINSPPPEPTITPESSTQHKAKQNHNR